MAIQVRRRQFITTLCGVATADYGGGQGVIRPDFRLSGPSLERSRCAGKRQVAL